MRIPKLRFKEFSGEWEEKRLEELGIIGRGKSKHRPRDDKKLFGGKYPFIQTGDIRNAGLFLNNYTQTYSDFGLEQSKLWKAGTLCITIAANIAETSILNIDACFPDSIIGINVFNDKANNIFLKMYFDFKRRDFEKISEGLAQSNLNLDKLKSMFFKIPIIKEQEKIGNFLSSVDKKISITEEKLNLFKEYKKGMMQKIFKQEIRFKDSNGNNYPEWEEKKLGDFYDFKYGQFNTNPSNGGEYPVYGASGVIGGYTSYNAEKSVIIGHMGAYAGSVLWEEKKHFVTYNGTISKPKNEKGFDSKYGYYLLNSLNIMKICAGSGQPFLAYETLNKIKVKSSFIFEEQQKIANLLSSIDNKIENLSAELENLKLFKKGLLQKMFI